MDFANLSFLVGVLAAGLAKRYLVKDAGAFRDKLLPAIVFAANLVTRLVEGFVSASPAPIAPAILHASVFGGFLAVLKYPAAAFLDSLMSLGVHRTKRWLDVMVK